MSEKATTPVAPICLRRKEAAAALGIGESKLWEITQNTDAAVPHFHIGSAVLYPVDELKEWARKQAKLRRKI